MMKHRYSRWFLQPRCNDGRFSLRNRSDQSGVALVEFALIVPTFLLLIFGMIDFGRAYSTSITLTNAVREGARYGITNPTDTAGIIAKVQNAAGPYNTGSLTVPNPTCSASCSSGQSVVVTSSYSFSFITPLAAIANFISGGSIPSTFTINNSATMRIE
ncbi:MAG TPA: TadE/TadG family type IV pilus assembly protein [Dehalococcoidia bacterium]|nr:TadE/TadG family type IV pilus assembly protein [Dehalococcoidia bacterium]